MHFAFRLIACLGGALMAAPAFCQTFNITDYGAIPDGKTINTRSIQRAIDACAIAGGEVIVPEGVFLSGTLYLKSNVHLQIEKEGVLKGSPEFKDYPDNQVHYVNAFTHRQDGTQNSNKAFLFAEHVHDVEISGSGTIDGDGDSPEFNLGNDDNAQSRSRPCMLLIIDARNITVSDLFLTNSAYWLQNYLGCNGLTLKNLTIYNHTNFNQDAMDIDAANVLVENCTIDTDDDGICFKSHDKNRLPEHIVVRDCDIASNCNAIKFGTLSRAGLNDVDISHCTIHKASKDNIRHWQQHLKFIDQPVTVISGIALEAVDGGRISNIRISHIRMQDVQTPIFIVLGNRGKTQTGGAQFYTDKGDFSKHMKDQVGGIENVLLAHIKAESHSKMTSSVTAFPGHYVKNVRLHDIEFTGMGGGTKQDADTELGEHPAAYPENRMYGLVYPSSGLYARHVDGLIIDNVTFRVRNPDARPVIAFDDVKNYKLTRLHFYPPASEAAAIRIREPEAE